MQSSDLKKKAHLRELVLSLMIMGALVFAVNSFAIAPKKEKLTQLDKQLEELKKEAETIDKENQELKAKLEEQKRIERALPIAQVMPAGQAVSKNPRVQMLQGKLKPDYDEVSDFLNAITKPEFRLTLEIQSLSYSDPKRESGYISTRFTLIARGPFGTTVDFIEKLENVKALMGIDQISIDVDKTDTRQVTLELVGAFYKLEDGNG